MQKKQHLRFSEKDAELAEIAVRAYIMSQFIDIGVPAD